MRPSNDHELAIARIIDQIAVEDRLNPSVIDEIISKLGFTLRLSESKFLVEYLRWRMEHPIVKPGQ